MIQLGGVPKRDVLQPPLPSNGPPWLGSPQWKSLVLPTCCPLGFTRAKQGWGVGRSLQRLNPWFYLFFFFCFLKEAESPLEPFAFHSSWSVHCRIPCYPSRTKRRRWWWPPLDVSNSSVLLLMAILAPAPGKQNPTSVLLPVAHFFCRGTTREEEEKK